MSDEVTERPGADLVALIEEIARTTEPALREHLIDGFVRYTQPLNRSIAASLCRDFKADRNTWLDDFCQYVSMAAVEILREFAVSPEKAQEVVSYRAFLHFRSRNAVTRFIDSSAGFNHASGQSNLKRRRRELERTRAALYLKGAEPADIDIVEETNKRMLATRSDAHRQGMICTVEDLHIAETAENIEDHAHPVAVETVESDSELHSTERQRLIFMCIDACDKESEQLGDIAREWFKPALDATYDSHPTAASIAVTIGIEASTARAKVARVKQIAQTVARQRFGIRNNRHDT